MRQLILSRVQKDPSNSALFTNRAFARSKLLSWHACLDDCIKAIEIQPDSLKGYYYLAQAQLALSHPNEAVSSALTAYELCLKTNSTSTAAVAAVVLQAKKQKWEVKERDRLRRRSHLLQELEEAITRNGAIELAAVDNRHEIRGLTDSEAREEREDIQTSTRQNIEEVRSVFAIADPANFSRRVLKLHMHSPRLFLRRYARKYRIT